MKIITNNKPRDIIHGFELSDKEKQEFDYVDIIENATFFRYKDQVYDTGEFMRVDSMAPWQGINSDSAFSGILIRYTADFEQVIVGRYYS